MSDSSIPPKRPTICQVCRRVIEDDPVIFTVSELYWGMVCEACMPKVEICTDYGRGELRADGERNWTWDW